MAKEREGILSLCAVVLRQRVFRGALLMRRQWFLFFARALVLSVFVLAVCQSALADEKASPAAKGEKADCVLDREAYRKAMSTPVTIQVKDVPLTDFVAIVKDRTHVQMLLDEKALEDAGIAKDTPVTLDVTDLPAREVLAHVLHRRLGLTTIRLDNYVLVTTLEVADSRLQLITYDVTDLVMRQDADGRWYESELEALAEALVGTIRPTSWDTVGGPGSIKPLELPLCAALVCGQTQDVHMQIEDMLAQWRKLEAQRRGTAALPVPSAEVMLRRSLQGRIRDDDNFHQGGALVPNEHRDRVAQQANLLAWDLFHRLKGRSDENLLFSPAGAALCLAVLQAGAKEGTGDELNALLHLRTNTPGGMQWLLPESQVTPAFAALLESMGAEYATHGYDLRLAGSLALAARKGCLPRFSEASHQLGVKILNCAPLEPAALGNEIDAWTAEATRGMLVEGKSLQRAESTTGGALRMVTAFQGRWKKPFESEATATVEFRGGAKRWQVPMMASVEPLNYLEVDGVQIVEKFYRGGNVSLVVLVPRDRAAALSALEKRLNAATADDWLNRSRTTLVELHLPRFRISREFDLKAFLMDLGLSTAFAKGKANFTGIDDSSGTSPYFDCFEQLVDVKVDEGGTPVKLVPPGEMEFPLRGDGRQQLLKPVVVCADHPFLFLIRDARTGVILFIGRYAVPTEIAKKGPEPASPNGGRLYVVPGFAD